MAIKTLTHRYKAYANISAGSDHHKLERNDCVVRALALAAGISYDESHALLEKHGRQYAKGTSWMTHRNAIKDLNGTAVIDTPNTKLAKFTLNSFITNHPTGSYFVIRRGHAIAVINGRVYDWQYTDTGERSKVLYAAKF